MNSGAISRVIFVVLCSLHFKQFEVILHLLGDTVSNPKQLFFGSSTESHVWKPGEAAERDPAGDDVQHRGQSEVQLQPRLLFGRPRVAHVPRQLRKQRLLGLPAPLLQR